MSSEDGKYSIIGWQGEKYVAVKNKIGKLSTLVIEQGSQAIKRRSRQVRPGILGQGWEMTINAIEARSQSKTGMVYIEKGWG